MSSRSEIEKLEAQMFVLIVVFVLAVIGAAILAGIIYTENERAAIVAESRCIESVWQASAVDRDVWYCVDYGLEPRIERIGTVDELAGEWEQ